MQTIDLNFKKFLLVIVSILSAAAFTACGDDDEPNREDFIQSYYDGVYTPGSAEHALVATLDGEPLASSSAAVTFRSSDMKKATITVKGIFTGGTKTFNNVPLITSSTDGEICNFELSEGSTNYGTGAIAGAPYGSGYVMTLTLKN